MIEVSSEEGITMVRTIGVGWVGLCIAWGTAAMAMAGAGGDEGLFRELSLDRVRQAAADGGKRFVLVDFYTVWCRPCKKLDETTWKDQEVRDWLSKEAVCLKVDAEKDEPLADKDPQTPRFRAWPLLALVATSRSGPGLETKMVRTADPTKQGNKEMCG